MRDLVPAKILEMVEANPDRFAHICRHIIGEADSEKYLARIAHAAHESSWTITEQIAQEVDHFIIIGQLKIFDDGNSFQYFSRIR